MIEVSVVMGVYNAGDTVRETVESILAQEGVELELVAVDDGSTDGGAAILEAYAARDNRVRIIRQENAGLTRALIVGCDAARGAYVARQDAGDISHPARLVTQVKMLSAEADIVFVSCATQYAGPDLEPLWVARPSGAALRPVHILDLSRSSPLIDGPTHHGSVMFRRDRYDEVGGYRPAFYYGQDFDLWYRLAEVGRFQSSEAVLYTARVTADSISGTARAQQERLATLSRAALVARQKGLSESEFLAEARTIQRVRGTGWGRRGRGLYFIGEMLRRNGNTLSRQYLRRSIAAWPFSPRAWVRYVQAVLT